MTEEIPTEMNVFIPPVPPPPPPTAPSALPSEQLLTSSSTAIPAKSLTHLPKRPPVDIEFSDITYTVPTAKGKHYYYHYHHHHYHRRRSRN
ncbi:hypothetical protein Phum_PHUM401220 [Pediculus humanus corporis]|uniref:Uncharacterized protein n=1 Tax=Pediculus humanus subsp. corporis TaxID=121224 RepID=E0VRQ1_PEDHC|nr:uncharacterized protein Phum_PHUM401220 [Pediculus humanus corporis]EEB16057.1 hypothetical protein Phum_PHUM401220 [Pediculus humanus corporis]